MRLLAVGGWWIGRLRVKFTRVLVALLAAVEAKHWMVLSAYAALFALVILKMFPQPLLMASEVVGLGDTARANIAWGIEFLAHGVPYVFAAVTMAVLLLLFLVRRWLDPVAKQGGIEDTATALDASKITQAFSIGQGDLPSLVALGDEAFAAWGATSEERRQAYEKFLDNVPAAFSLIRLVGSKDAQGFTCVLPLTEEGFRRFRLGIVDSWEFGTGDLLMPRDMPAEYLCLNAIYMQRALSREPNARAVRVLCSHIARFIKTKEGSMKRPLLVAEGLTYEGRKFLVRYGFTSAYSARDRAPLYELDLSRPRIISDRARTFEKCLETAFNASH